jgi:hypothetical protein
LRKAYAQTITIQDQHGAAATGANPVYWRNTTDLISYFLLDVEMGADQLTSRIKQAISSVQMFVQRCMLNLEQPWVEVIPVSKDAAEPNSWGQWEYMKNYRVWQAARKILLYPENWIEPELRAGKSPFFKEMEDQLSTDDMTAEHAEECFRNYLEKVDTVSRLTVVGVYHDVSRDQADQRDWLHLVARTNDDPAIFFYRRFDQLTETWSPWERIDIDIAGDHVHPMVYNRKLYLFWLVFVEKPQKMLKQPPNKPSNEPSDSAEVPKQLEIQLAWTQRKGNGWTPKTVSKQKLIHPWERPQSSYHLRPRYEDRKGENELWLDLYLSSSKEFNGSKFYDPFVNIRIWQSNTGYESTGKPWHSSSFVFTGGAVAAVKMRSLKGWFHAMDGVPVFPVGRYNLESLGYCMRPATLCGSESIKFINKAFGPEGRAIEKLDAVQPDITAAAGVQGWYNRLAPPVGTVQSSIYAVGVSKAIAVCPRDARPFEMVVSENWSKVLYQDRLRSFFAMRQGGGACYTFYPFYHPYTKHFLRELDRLGVGGLLCRKIQTHPEKFFPVSTFNFGTYEPTQEVHESAKKECVDFSQMGAYSVYNWEAFFHGPFLIACRLMQNQRFEEAMRWFQYIFDPTGLDGEVREVPKRFWITKPFYEQNSSDYRKQRIQELLGNLTSKTNQTAIYAWRNDPFNPHRVAEHRPVAYQRAVVMRYIDNLIAWGDQLFRRDTMESINEATMLYLVAYEILGQRPVLVPDTGRSDVSYAQLTANGGLDILGNKGVLASVENHIGGVSKATTAAAETTMSVAAGISSTLGQLSYVGNAGAGTTASALVQQASQQVSAINKVPKLDAVAKLLPVLNLYFRIPPNDELLSRWDLVADRLYKIRHSLSIDGVFRQLPLFEPPIDPALLVKASAAGVDIGSVLMGGSMPAGPYRFRVTVAKAMEYCSEVRALGEKLLSILEKRDAEELVLLRSSQETKLLEATRQVRKLQISEATETIGSLLKSKQQAETRRDYYVERDFRNSWETAAARMAGAAMVADAALGISHLFSAAVQQTPTCTAGGAGMAGPVVLATTVDGNKMAGSSEKTISAIRTGIVATERSAGLIQTHGSYKRREDDWKHQAELASIDISSIERQIVGAQIRRAVAERELENLESQIDNAKTVEEYYKSKYTSKELYDWMLQQVSTVYFGAYKLAHDMALRAEKCMQYELGDTKISFIQYGYWDSLKKGLMAAEKLAHDIRRMDSAYLDLHKREFELTKHISLAGLEPAKVLELKATGTCEFELPEWLFDMDFPAHYRRRIKSVSLTIPCIAGPYTGVHAALDLVGETVRLADGAASLDGYAVPTTVTQSIATSTAEYDSGVFELNFNDERYLPFEGAGAISKWTLRLTSKSNLFDVQTISDVILHVRYTSVGGTEERAIENQCGILLDLRRDFPLEWQQFLDQVPDQGKRVVEFSLDEKHIPFYARGKQLTVKQVDLTVPGHSAQVDSPVVGNSALDPWRVEIEGDDIDVANLAIILGWDT